MRNLKRGNSELAVFLCHYIHNIIAILQVKYNATALPTAGLTHLSHTQKHVATLSMKVLLKRFVVTNTPNPT